MIVVDASVIVDFLLDLPPAERLRVRLHGERTWAAPHLLDAEVGQVLRGRVAGRKLAVARAEEALEDLAALPLVRYSHVPLMGRAFALRGNVTFYDALYLALAEALDAPLLTGDAALARVPGATARVETVR